MKLDIPPDWKKSVAEILRKHPSGRIMILGETDRGKSTYCDFLRRELERSGKHVNLLDADIGQKDVGPPATITLALSGQEPSGFYFVGSVSPVGHFLPMIVGAARLAAQAPAPFLVINTTGFVHGPGKVLKSFKIEALRPDVIVAIEAARELETILSEHPHIPAIRIKPSPSVRLKSPAFRAEVRNSAFFRYFESASVHRFKKSDLVIQRQIDAELTNRLCGVADRSGECLGLGIVRKVLRGALEIETPVPKGRIRILQLGDLWLPK